MSARRLALAGIATAAVALVAQGAYATGGGNNTGVTGVVFNNATVGGVTFNGSCEYVLTSRLSIAGHATATSTPAVQATSITCTVEHGSPVPPTVSSSGFKSGSVATTDSIGQLQVRGTAVCITMSAELSDGSIVTTGQFCVS